MSVRITCVSKPSGSDINSHEAISELGWINEATKATGRSTRLTVYDWLKNKGGEAYVRDAAGDVAYLFPRENANGTKYVQTYADNTWKDNLLHQPNCV